MSSKRIHDTETGVTTAMTKTTRNLLIVFVALFFSGIVVLLFFFNSLVAIRNFVAGYANALLVLGASSLGYWQLVQGSDEKRPHHDLPDPCEKIDDRFGLWEEVSPLKSSNNVAEILQQEKKRLKKERKGLEGWLENARPALSLYRLAAYVVLAGTVLWLIDIDSFEPLFYLLGAGLAPVGMAVGLWLSR